MSPAVAYLGLFVLWVGIFFCGVGVIGLMRFPDVFTRLHASGKVATLGLSFTLIGTSILIPEITLKAIVLIVFVVLTSPVSSHAIASAAHRIIGRLPDDARDDLAECRDHEHDAEEHEERIETLVVE
jgi:multicomponent Na+:H+ antiporter subunit G